MEREARIRDLSAAIASRRWNSCSELLYRILYGLPSSVLLPLAAGQIERMLPALEKHWPGILWPREIVENTPAWLATFGRSIPDSPERTSVAEAGFVFSLDALLLAHSYPGNPSVSTSSCACAIREIVGLGVQLSLGQGWPAEDKLESCEGCTAALKQKPATDPDSPVEFARSREWQRVLDAILARNLRNYPDPESPAQLEADLAVWKDHAELLIVPEAELVNR